jgi:hypothetical protein
MSDNERRQPPPIIDETPVLPDLTMVTVETEFGPIAMSDHLVRTFNRDGWPENSVLKQMADMQPSPERPVSSEETSG